MDGLSIADSDVSITRHVLYTMKCPNCGWQALLMPRPMPCPNCDLRESKG